MTGHATATAPIFIIGNPRSGTTLLRLMLTCHPHIVVPPEAGFAVNLMPAHAGFRGAPGELEHFLSDLLASPKFEHWQLARPVLETYLRETVAPRDYASLVAGVYACYGAVHQPGKPRWGDKNNFYLAHIPALATLFPEARFVHIVRDGRDVACSYRSLANVKGKYAPTLPSATFDAVYQWRGNLRRIQRSFAAIGWSRVHELRYEDLVRDPKGTLVRACEFLGEDFAPAMLESDRENRNRQLEPREFDAWKRRNQEGIDASAIGRWESELSPDDAQLAHLAGGDMLRHYRYASAHPVGARIWIRYAVRVISHEASRWLGRARRRVAIRATSSSA
ncbi:MAG TPA: sulfotransferase [Candidatus Krumholzibacteria bacterium]|nr:sulfotransferase [Candidatus Krumholzibacteria bacterium]